MAPAPVKPNPHSRRIGTRFATLRTAMRLSQVELARRLNASQSTIADIEKGTIRRPHARLLREQGDLALFYILRQNLYERQQWWDHSVYEEGFAHTVAKVMARYEVNAFHATMMVLTEAATFPRLAQYGLGEIHGSLVDDADAFAAAVKLLTDLPPPPVDCPVEWLMSGPLREEFTFPSDPAQNEIPAAPDVVDNQPAAEQETPDAEQ